MPVDWNGKTYDFAFHPINAWGERQGDYDQAADASWRAAGSPIGGNNPSTQHGSSPWGGNTGPAPTPYQPSAFGNQVESRLLADLNLDPRVDQNDPAYKQQIDSFNYAADRNRKRQRAQTAQRMSAQGTLGGGGFDTAVERLGSEQGAQEQAFEGQLLGKFRDQNLERQARALGLGTGLLSQEREQALRRQLTEAGYGLQRELGWGDINYRRDALGQNLALSQANLDQQAMLALLGR